MRSMQPAGAMGSCVALLLLLASCAEARTVWLTFPYQVQGFETVFGPDGAPGKWGVGSRIVSAKTLLDPRGTKIGQATGDCSVVAAAGGGAYVALCTVHFDLDRNGNRMIAHYTQRMAPGRPVKATAVVAGGIGSDWEGAHGIDTSYTYDPQTGRGSGKIELTCLKGKC